MPVLDRGQLAHRFAHHPPQTTRVGELHGQVRHRCWQLAEWLNVMLPSSPEAEQALAALDLVCMHANAAVARHANEEPA